MADPRLKEIAAEAMRLNMRLYGAWLDASRDYLGALRDLAQKELAKQPADPARASSRATAKPAARPATPAIPPLVLAAAAGGAATAAFSVSNSTGKLLEAAPQLSPDLIAAGLSAEPARQAIAPGAAATFTLQLTLPKTGGRAGDTHGHVSIPDLGDRQIPVVLRHLGGAQPAMTAPAAKPEKSKRKRKPT